MSVFADFFVGKLRLYGVNKQSQSRETFQNMEIDGPGKMAFFRILFSKQAPWCMKCSYVDIKIPLINHLIW